MSFENDITQIKNILEKDEPIFKAASPEELSKRPKSDSPWVRIESLDQLKRLAIYGVEVVITLSGGVRSTKYISYGYDREDDWHIDNYIDGSITDNLEETNIPEAMAKGALWYDRKEYEETRQQGENEQLPEATDPVFKAASPEQIAHRREMFPLTSFYRGREYGPRSNMGVCMAFVNGSTRGTSNSMSIRPAREEGVTVLYSYGTPIALRQNDTVFYCSQKYSITTSCQQSRLRHATGGNHRVVDPKEFVQMLHAVGVYETGRLHEAKPIFKPASPEQQAKRKELYQKEIGAAHGDWAEVARAELSRLLNVEIVFSEYEYYEDLGAVAMKCANEREEGNNGESEWIVFPDSETAERAAITKVKQDLDDQPEIFNKDWLSSYIDVYDKESMASEEADYYMEGMSDEDVLSESGRDVEYNELQEQVDALDFDDPGAEARQQELESQQEQILEEARESVKDNKASEIEGELDDPVYYFVERQGTYTLEDLLKAPFININIDEAAEDAVSQDGVAHFLDGYDSDEIELPSGAFAYGTN